MASRLHEQDPLLSILVIEAGSDVTEHPLVSPAATAPLLVSPAATPPLLLRSVLDWRYSTVPQRHLERRILLRHAGTAFGGGSATDSSEMTTRLGRKLVNDPKRRYEGFLPYFRKTEHYHDTAANLKEHGLEGPVHTASVTSSGRKYLLPQQVQEAWATVGVREPSDATSGSPQGQ